MEDLESRLKLVGEDLIKPINKIIITSEDISSFGDVVGDYNKIHRSKKAAEKMGFKDTPVIGVHLAALGGKLSRDLLAIIRENNPTMNFVGQKVIFKNPVYPGIINRPKWNWEGVEISPSGEITTQIVAKKGKERKFEIQSKYAPELPFPEEHLQEQFVYRETAVIKPRAIEEFYKKLKDKPNQRKATFTHGVSLIATTLLNFLERLNKKEGKDHTGLNREMNSRFYGEVMQGKSLIEIYQIGERKMRDRIMYIFDGILYQNEIPRIATKIKCLTEGKLNTRALRKEFGYEEVA